MKAISFSGLSLLCSRTDEEAMCRVKTHDDHGEFDRLVARWEQPIRRLCVRMTGDVHRGEDLKQETFVRLFEKRKDYQPTGKFSTSLILMKPEAAPEGADPLLRRLLRTR